MGGGLTSHSRIVLAGQRLILRTARTPLGRVWAMFQMGLARLVRSYVARGAETKPAWYLRGSVDTGDFLPGLSDLDTALVFGDPGARQACERATGRWQLLSHRLPAIGLLLDGPMVYPEADLRDLAGQTALTFGLDATAGRGTGGSAYFGRRASFDWLRKLERPGLYGSTEDWRLVDGPDRRAPEPDRDPQAQLIAGWLELLYFWRWAFPACIDPGPRSARLCVTLAAEPARIWLWLGHGERAGDQGQALRLAMARLPEEEEALGRALALRRALPHSPAPPLADALPLLVRMSARIAALISSRLEGAAVTEVRLHGTDLDQLVLPMGVEARGRPLPLADWRALACPLLPDESFLPLPGDPGDPGALAAAAVAHPSGPYPAVRAEGLMVMPAGAWWRTRLRAIQCEATDPVSFALVDGRLSASFPRVAGWSAEHAARRAIAEHRAYLRGEPGPWAVRDSAHGHGGSLAMLLSAARAGLFAASLLEGEPGLSLTVAETARLLAERWPAKRSVAEQALEGYREFVRERRQPGLKLVQAMRGLTLELPAYADART
jgi:hypothetical protein